MKRLALLLGVVACGGAGGAKRPDQNPPPTHQASGCDAMAKHLAAASFTWEEPPPGSQERVATVLREHCEQDRWSQDVQACFGMVTDEQSAGPCTDKLTPQQLDKVMGPMYAKSDDSTGSGDSSPN